MKLNKQRGFTIVEFLLIIAVIGLLVFAGWNFMRATNEGNDTQETGQQEEVPAVKTADDLQNAEEFLNNSSLDEDLDTTELDESFDEVL